MGKRLRRWPNVNPALVRSLLFAGTPGVTYSQSPTPPLGLLISFSQAAWSAAIIYRANRDSGVWLYMGSGSLMVRMRPRGLRITTRYKIAAGQKQILPISIRM